MADAFIQLPAQSTGLKVDTTELVVGANTVERERINIADPTSATQIATVTAANALKVDNSAVTQPVSGTVTANIGTTGGLALDASVTAVQPRRLQDGVGATLATVTAANALKVDGSAVTQPVSIAAAVDVSDRAVRLVGQVEGRAASGTAKAGNPNQVGGVFNTTQPTVTTGQAVEAQSTARGALIVATGVDTFTVAGTVSTTPPANASTNVAQFGGNAVVTGTGVSGLGIPRVTISNDSSLAANQSVNVAQIAGSATSTAAAGVQKVGIVGNAGAVVDAAQNAAAPANELVAGGVYNTTIPALTAGNASQIQLDATGGQYVNTEGRKTTYSAFASFTPVAGDIAVLPGSASKTIRVTRVEVSMSTSGTAAVEQIQLIKRSTADSAGTSAAMTAVPHDSNFAAASAAPLSYTAAPTLGTAVGAVRGVQYNDASASVAGANTWLWTFGDRPGACIVLRGTAQQLAINLGAVVATQTVTVSFEWTEE